VVALKRDVKFAIKIIENYIGKKEKKIQKEKNKIKSGLIDLEKKIRRRLENTIETVDSVKIGKDIWKIKKIPTREIMKIIYKQN